MGGFNEGEKVLLVVVAGAVCGGVCGGSVAGGATGGNDVTDGTDGIESGDA